MLQKKSETKPSPGLYRLKLSRLDALQGALSHPWHPISKKKKKSHGREGTLEEWLQEVRAPAQQPRGQVQTPVLPGGRKGGEGERKERIRPMGKKWNQSSFSLHGELQLPHSIPW
jgi:hypothetical protein